jgi:fermentation-respiration switch protein FrsA (DUF1100 family)
MTVWLILWPLLRILLIAYTVWLVGLYWRQDSLLFPSSFAPDVRKQKPPKTAEQVWISDEDGNKVEAWFLPPLELKEDKPYPVVIFFHGNAEVIDFYAREMYPYRELGIGVLLPEYRGYGRSGGKPGQKNIAADMRQFYDWLVKRPQVDKSRIFYHGRSVGGGMACQLAADRPPAALILQSTFTSVAAMARRFLAPPFLLRHPFYNDHVVRKLSCPIFITHGSHDAIIPVSHGRELARLAPQAVYYEVDSDHNDYPMDERFWQQIRAFLLNGKILLD